jgi:hypothetical protein
VSIPHKWQGYSSQLPLLQQQIELIAIPLRQKKTKTKKDFA